MPHQGYLIGKYAITIPKPTGASLFDSQIYDYALLEEFSIAAYHSGHYGDCLRAIERLLTDGKIPQEAHERLRKNAQAAREALPGRRRPPNRQLPRFRTGS